MADEQNAGAGAGGAGGAPPPDAVKLDGKNWMEFVPAEFKTDPIWKSYEGKDASEVFKAHVNQGKLIGGDKIVVPAGKLDTDANWDQVFDKLGRPKDPKDYKLEIPQGVIPEGVTLDPVLDDEFKKVCHKVGILPRQAQEVYGWFAKMSGALMAKTKGEEDAAFEQASESLKRELGTKDKFDQFVSMSNKVVSLYSGSQEAAARVIDKHGNDPDIIRLLGNIGKAMDEDALVTGGKRFADGADPRVKLMDIQSNKANPLFDAYWKADHPQHQHAVDEVFRLTQLVHGNKPIGRA